MSTTASDELKRQKQALKQERKALKRKARPLEEYSQVLPIRKTIGHAICTQTYGIPHNAILAKYNLATSIDKIAEHNSHIAPLLLYTALGAIGFSSLNSKYAPKEKKFKHFFSDKANGFALFGKSLGRYTGKASVYILDDMEKAGAEEVLATFLHEITHRVDRWLFPGDGDESSSKLAIDLDAFEKKFKEIDKSKPFYHPYNILASIVSHYDDRSTWKSEMLARTAEILYQRGGEAFLKKEVPELLQFWNERLMPKIYTAIASSYTEEAKGMLMVPISLDRKIKEELSSYAEGRAAVRLASTQAIPALKKSAQKLERDHTL